MRILICDVCHRPGVAANTYTIERDGVKVSTERCAEHGRPFEEVFNGDTPAAQPASAPPSEAAPKKAQKAVAAQKPQEVAVGKGQEATGEPAKRRGRRSLAVTTMDGIDALKAQEAKKAKQKT